MAKYKCQLCGHIYDEEKEGVKFEDLPDDWKCPMCFAPKNMFKLVEEDAKQEEKVESKEETRKNFCFWRKILRCATVGLTSFVTERRIKKAA